MTLSEIALKHEQLFHWAEQEFRARLENGQDAVEVAMLMECCLTALTAIHVSIP